MLSTSVYLFLSSDFHRDMWYTNLLGNTWYVTTMLVPFESALTVGGLIAGKTGITVGVAVGVFVGVGVGQYGSPSLPRSLVAMFLSPCGMHPVKLLDPPLSSRVFRLVSFSRSAGMDPDSRLWPRVRVCKLVMSPSLAGMEPVSRLPLSPRCSKFTRYPSREGMEPRSWLFLRSSLVSSTSVCSCSGTRPVRPLFINAISVTRWMRPTLLTLIPSHCVMGMFVLQLSVPDPARLSFMPRSVTHSAANLDLLW